MGQAAKPAFWAVRVAEKRKAHAYYPSIGIFNCVGGWEKTHKDNQRSKGKSLPPPSHCAHACPCATPIITLILTQHFLWKLWVQVTLMSVSDQG